MIIEGIQKVPGIFSSWGRGIASALFKSHSMPTSISMSNGENHGIFVSCTEQSVFYKSFSYLACGAVRVSYLEDVFFVVVPREFAEEMVEDRHVEITHGLGIITPQVNLLLEVAIDKGFFHVANVGENKMA